MIRTLVEIRDGRVSIQETADETTVTVTVDGAPSSMGDLDEVHRVSNHVRKLGDRLRKRDTAYVELEDELVRRTRERDERERARADLEKSMGEEVRKLRAQVAEYDRDRKTERDRANQADTNRKLERDRNDRLQERMVKAEAELDRLKKGHVCTPSCKPNAHVAFIGHQRLVELEAELHDETERADQAEKSLEESRALVEFKDKIRADIDRDNVKLRGKVRELAAKVRAARELLTTGEVAQARRMDCSRTGTVMGYAIGAALRALDGPPSPPTDETSQA